LFGAAALTLAGRGILARGEEAHIRAKYGALLVNVRESDLLDGRRPVAVASIDDLAKIAERTGRMILYQALGTERVYLVRDSDIAYCYRSVDAVQIAHVSVSGEQ
jgi:precorrin-6x reductase